MGMPVSSYCTEQLILWNTVILNIQPYCDVTLVQNMLWHVVIVLIVIII